MILTYSNIICWLLKRISIYRKNSRNSKLNIIKKFCYRLGNPQYSFKSIHIGGTNGKGSVVHMLSSILQESGYIIGSFTSPHLINFRERIVYNKILIEKEFIVDFIRENKNFIENENISFFEINTVLAFQYFKEKKIDIALIEVGLGGRLDSTNIIKPELSIITNVSLDHRDVLGNTEIRIAKEKSGIIKNNTSIIIGSNNAYKINFLFLQEAFEKNSPIYFTLFKTNKESMYKTYFTSFYQDLNKSLVLNSINILRQRKKIYISNEAIVKGFKRIFKNTIFKGRWQIINKKNPKIICDVAHNEEGIKMMNLQLQKENYNNLHLVLGFLIKKEVRRFIKYFPINSNYYFCQPNISNKYPINELKILINKYLKIKKRINFYNTVKKAFYEARKNSVKGDLIIVSGSTFVVSEIF